MGSTAERVNHIGVRTGVQRIGMGGNHGRMDSGDTLDMIFGSCGSVNSNQPIARLWDRSAEVVMLDCSDYRKEKR